MKNFKIISNKIKWIFLFFLLTYFLWMLFIYPMGNCYEKNPLKNQEALDSSINKKYLILRCNGWGGRGSTSHSIELYDAVTKRLLFQREHTYGSSNRRDAPDIYYFNNSIEVYTDDADEINGEAYGKIIKISLPPPWYEQVRAYIISIF
jgi:hypothetical protein